MPQAIPLHSHTHTHARTSPRSISFVQDCCSGAAAARDTRVRAQGSHHNRGKCKRIQSLCPSVQLISSSFFLGHVWLLRRPPLCARVGPHSRHPSVDIACLSTSGIAQGRVAPHPASCQTLRFFWTLALQRTLLTIQQPAPTRNSLIRARSHPHPHQCSLLPIQQPAPTRNSLTRVRSHTHPHRLTPPHPLPLLCTRPTHSHTRACAALVDVRRAPQGCCEACARGE